MPDNAPQNISIVIATYNRCRVLKETLRRLAAQSIEARRFEVIVVDDGSSDDTADEIPPLLTAMPYAASFHRHDNRGPGYTENRGIRLAANDLVLLLADDIWAEPTLVEEHLRSHTQHPEEQVAVLGKVLQSPDLPQTVIQKNWDPFLFHRFEHLQTVEPIFFYACNISIKKPFLLRHGMFVDRKGAAHEDAELGYRLGRHGLRIVYNKNALAYHFHEETLDAMCKRAYERGKNFDVLAASIPASYLYPIYKIVSPAAGWSYFLKNLPREILRRLLFNHLTVPALWVPLLRRAETTPFAANLARPLAYRGVNGFFLRKGIHELAAQGRLPRCPH